jgi:hypothetical protein
VVTSRDEIARHLAAAEGFARLEIITALRQPQRKLMTILAHRIVDLQQLEEIEKHFGSYQPEWGDF